MQRHGFVDSPPNHNQERRDKQRNLYARADSDAHRQVHLVLHGDHDSRDMLRRVANNRDQYKSHEILADPCCLHDVIDARDEVIRANADDDGRDEEDDGSGDGAHAGLLGLGIGVELRDVGVLEVTVEEVVVGAQLEVEIEAVEEEEDDGSAAREQEDGVAGVGLYPLLLAVKDVIELECVSGMKGKVGKGV